MTDTFADFPAGSAVLAVAFPTTMRAVKALGGPYLPGAFVVVVDRGWVRFVDRRRRDEVWELPASSVESVSVAETQSGPPYIQVALAIVLRVRTGTGHTDLPIVPVSDDGKRSLTWGDAEVRVLATRLSTALKGAATSSGDENANT